MLDLTEAEAARQRVVYNHLITGYHDLQSVVGVDRYMARVLGSTQPGDVVMITPSLKGEFAYIREHYARVGLAHTDEVVWDGGFDALGDFPNARISVFMFTEEVHAVRPDPRWLQAVALMNSKNEFMRCCHELEVPVPATHCFAGRRAFDADHSSFEYPVYVKLDVSATGVGVYRCESRAHLISCLNTKVGIQPFQIQRAIEDAFAFVNIAYDIREGELYRDVATVQILDGVTHVGNQCPTRYAPWELTDVLASHIIGLGLQGKFAFDVAVAGTEFRPRFYILECNPRWNGSHYSAVAAKKLGATNWEGHYFKTSKRSLREVALGNLEYSPERGSGVVMINWGPIVDGKLGCLVIGETNEHVASLAEATRRLLH